MYYKNYISINIEISNFEEIKKKYFDDEGIRYKKGVLENNVTKTTLYYYDNHKLIAEIEAGVRRDYIYDSKGDMYGYVVGN